MVGGKVLEGGIFWCFFLGISFVICVLLVWKDNGGMLWVDDWVYMYIYIYIVVNCLGGGCKGISMLN